MTAFLAVLAMAAAAPVDGQLTLLEEYHDTRVNVELPDDLATAHRLAGIATLTDGPGKEPT